jgi:hypothetical protein
MSKDNCDKVEKEGNMKQKCISDMVSMLHHNVQSINNKLLELTVLLQFELADVDVLVCQNIG